MFSLGENNDSTTFRIKCHLYEPIKQQALKKHEKPEQIVIGLLRQLSEKPQTETDDFLQSAGCIHSDFTDIF